MNGPVRVACNRDRTRATLTLFDGKGNIVTAAMVEALRLALASIGADPHLKLITLEGAGRDFSFGASIPEHAPDRIGAVLPAMHGLIEDLLAAPAVTAAVVRGRCLGGGFELALACDFIFAADDAVFGLPEVALGVFPPAASALLPLRLGASRATRAIVTGDIRPAADWLATGLLELIAPAASLEAVVEQWFETHLASKSAAALRHAAWAARADVVARVSQTLPALERLYLNDLMRTHDAVEGIDAFMHKRPPSWKDC
ncbi:MAG TPA: enoyl-CoA hydratase/isomerase family protein [Vicinamibacterales bacterium]|nr:enoyl-CoA hydratase/isomerase family protein [Vicinamibacterales bacterium]